MHNFNHKDGGHKRMVWMMIPCLILFGFVFFGGNKLSSSGYFWPILIGIFAIAHIWMMIRGHGGRRDHDTEDTSDALEKKPNSKNEHKHGGGCH